MATMKKGKGYLDHVKPSGKSFGDPFKGDTIGQWETTSSLNEWDKGKWDFPKPKKGKKT
mgnify:CR=1 FL=1|jgi:hypothetical protein|tara:strand:+ start:2638 stop:2814 length:177 start_codon:yes stop_codon:yes gene_type:complete